MHDKPFLLFYGEEPMGQGVPSLTIGVTRDGKSGMSGANLAKLFRCNPLDLPALIYGDTGVSSHTETGPKLVKSQSGRGFSTHTTHRIPLSHRAGGKELHLYPAELIATAARKRYRHLLLRGADVAALEAFLDHFAAKGLDAAIKTALGWRATHRFLRQEDEVKPYRPQFRELYHAVKRKFGIKPTPNVWELVEEIITGMTAAARRQRDLLGLGYIHMAINDDGKNRLALDAEKAMLLLNASRSFKEFLENLIGWRSGRWQQKLDLQAA